MSNKIIYLVSNNFLNRYINKFLFHFYILFRLNRRETSFQKEVSKKTFSGCLGLWLLSIFVAFTRRKDSHPCSALLKMISCHFCANASSHLDKAYGGNLLAVV